MALRHAITLDIARAPDRPALARLAARLHSENGVDLAPGDARRMVPTLVVEGHRVRVARLDGDLAAYALWRERERSIYLRHFIVAPALRRLGIGEGFLALLLDHWPRHKDVCLHCRTASARRFWLAMGFRRVRDGLRYPRKPENAR